MFLDKSKIDSFRTPAMSSVTKRGREIKAEAEEGSVLTLQSRFLPHLGEGTAAAATEERGTEQMPREEESWL
jgi:hypothetical protein